MAWRTLGFVTCQIGPLQVVTKLYHLHAILSLVCLKMKRFKSIWARKTTFSTCALCSVLCEQREHRLPRLWHARAAWTGKYMKYVKLPLLASNFSNNSSILNLYTGVQMHRFILEHACLNTNCTVGTRARHTYICVHNTYTHIVWALTMLENGTSDTCRLIAWSIDVKQYIVRRLFVTASQTTQNNKPKLTKRCTPQSASLPPSRPVSH